MTADEARKVAVACWSADGGGCAVCAHDVGEALAELFPAFDWDALITSVQDVRLRDVLADAGACGLR